MDPEANIILGATFDETLNGWLRVLVVALDKTASVAAPETAFDGGLLKEPSKTDRPSEPQATYTVQKIKCEGKGVHSRYSDASGMWFTNAKYDRNKGTLFTLAGG